MATPSIRSEISNYKSQLDDFLSKKYVDPSLLLGFTAVLHSKFSAWIEKDIETYYYQTNGQSQNGQPDPVNFDLIQLFETIWGQFHHPIINFYKLQHIELYNVLVSSLRSPKPKFKLVEMRKLSEVFLKFILLAKSFYDNLAHKLIGKYEFRLVPRKFFMSGGFPVPTDCLKSTNSDFDANLTYTVYHCLLGLGNLARHNTQTYLNYSEPCLSVSNYYKFLKMPRELAAEREKRYDAAKLYYTMCIGLLPTLNEPYNHMGVIHNLMKQKMSALRWFLRSQFTRIPDYPIGRHNMDSIFLKPWLEGAFRETTKKKPSAYTLEDISVLLLKIIKHYFYTQKSQSPLYCEKTQSDLLDHLFPMGRARFDMDNSEYTEQLVVLFCFYSIAKAEMLRAAQEKYRRFVSLYISRYIRSALTQTAEDASKDLQEVLLNVRLIMAFVRKNHELTLFAKDLSDVLNLTFSELDDETRAKVSYACAELKTPVRSFYFDEDIQFKDFLLIGYQFKDFDDSHLFTCGSVDGLFGLKYLTEPKKVPLFLDNEAVQRIMKESELNGDDEGGQDLRILREVSHYVSVLRATAISVLALKVFEGKLVFDKETSTFATEKVDVPATQVPKTLPTAVSVKQEKTDKKTAKKAKAKVKKEKTKAADAAQKPQARTVIEDARFPVIATKAAPSSLEEIELMILGHASGLAKSQSTGAEETSLVELVDSIVDEPRQEKTEHAAKPDYENFKIAQRPKPTDEPIYQPTFLDPTQQHQGNTQQAPTQAVNSLFLTSLQVLQPPPMPPTGIPQPSVPAFQQFPPNVPLYPPQSFGYPQNSPLPYDVYAQFQPGPPQMAPGQLMHQGYGMNSGQPYMPPNGHNYGAPNANMNQQQFWH